MCLGLITQEWKVGKKLDFHTPEASMIDMIEVRNTRFVLLTWPRGLPPAFLLSDQICIHTSYTNTMLHTATTTAPCFAPQLLRDHDARLCCHTVVVPCCCASQCPEIHQLG